MVKVYIKTFGCSHNFADSEHMAGLLSEAGYDLSPKEDEADLVIFNTCTVKTPTEHSLFNKLKNSSNNGKVVVAGCIPQSDPEKLEKFSLIGTNQIDKIVEVVDKTLSGERVSFLKNNVNPSLLLPKIRINPLIEIVPINLGCLSKCTYCTTKAARGHLSSYPQEQIIQKIRESTSQGIKEVWLTSQDTACYGLDKGTNIAKLINEICKIEKDFKIRLGMGNPDHIIKIINELIKAMKDEKVYKFLHIPIQSGNNIVLKNMKREYTVEQYKEIIKKFKQEIPEITISTDIIVGFPGETKEQFEGSIDLIKDTKPDIVNLSRYWARDKTIAARMKQLPVEEVMKRSEKLSRIARKISQENKKRWIGWKGEVTINEKGKERNQWKARTHSYLQVTLKGEFRLRQKLKVEIESVTVHDLIAKAIN